MSVRISEFRGVSDLYCAEVTEVRRMVNGREVIEEQYGKPFQLAGVQNIDSEYTESSEAHYYDNVAAIVVDSEGDDTYTITMSVPTLKMRSILDGTQYDAKTGALLGVPKNKKYYAISFAGQKLNGETEFIWILKGKFSGGAQSHATMDDGTDATNMQYTFTSIQTAQAYEETPDEDGNPRKLKYMVVEGKQRVDVSKWFEQVVTPKTIQDIMLPELDAEIATVAPQYADPEDHSETWYLGKNGADLVTEDTEILASGKVAGTLIHNTGFTEFSSIEEEQEGYYFPFVLTKTGTKMEFIKNGVSKGEINWEANNIFRIESSGDVFEVKVDGETAMKLTFDIVEFN